MTVLKTLSCRVYSLIIVLGFAIGVLRFQEQSTASSVPIQFPLLPGAASSYYRDGFAGHRRMRAVKRENSISLFSAEESSEKGKDVEEERSAETEAAEATDDSSQRTDEKTTEKGEEENEKGSEREEALEEETASEAGEIPTSPEGYEKPTEEGGENYERGPQREAGAEEDTASEAGESVKAPEMHEKEEERRPVKLEEVYVTQKLPEPSVGVADAQEACDSMHCTKVVAGAGPKAKIKGCSRAIKCEDCRPQVDPEERCTAWKPPSRATITLATGWSTTKVKLIPGSAMHLPINWDSQDAFEDDLCLPDTKQVGYAFDKVKETGNVEKFPYTRVLNVQLAIYSIPIEGARETKKTPQMAYYIEVADPFPWNAVVPGGGSHPYSPRCYQSLQALPSVQLRGKSAVFGVGWFSVLKDKAHTLSPTNIGVRVECRGRKSCNMRKYAVCLRVTCPPTAASAERQMAAGLDAMKKPVGDITPNATETTSTVHETETGQEESYTVPPWDFNAWAYAPLPGWGDAWKSAEAGTALVFSLAVVCLALVQQL